MMDRLVRLLHMIYNPLYDIVYLHTYTIFMFYNVRL